MSTETSDPPVTDPEEPSGDDVPMVPKVARPPAIPPLARRPGEKKEQHRGMLLFLAQDAGERSFTLVARALGRHESTVRYWAKRFEWEVRAVQTQPGTQAAALAAYRKEYVGKVSAIELDAVRSRISIPLHPDDARPVREEPASESVREGRHTPPPGVTNAEHKTDHKGGRAPSRKHEAEITTLRQGITLHDALIARVAQKLIEPPMISQPDPKTPGKTVQVPNPRYYDPRVSPKDLPLLFENRLKLAQELERLETGADPQVQGKIEIPESYRVKAARASSNGDPLAVMRALADDLDDLKVVCVAIVNQGAADLDAKTRGEAALHAVQSDEEHEAAV